MLESLIQRLAKVGKAYLSKSKSGKFKPLTITGLFVFNLITMVVESHTKVPWLFEYKICERRALLGLGIILHKSSMKTMFACSLKTDSSLPSLVLKAKRIIHFSAAVSSHCLL